ncbi:hypothetical protein RvY_17997 [Ramazzottius varieornatus]|uniref:Uncharacterized protein n=1 Tax=Ramazzottius varieornatus TaxID=947166 RepID=A0A1D1W4B1_RAMVA|nr:hypothetical protein RvY_17997 [Ramazzottius varieornatus]
MNQWGDVFVDMLDADDVPRRRCGSLVSVHDLFLTIVRVLRDRRRQKAVIGVLNGLRDLRLLLTAGNAVFTTCPCARQAPWGTTTCILHVSRYQSR